MLKVESKVKEWGFEKLGNLPTNSKEVYNKKYDNGVMVIINDIINKKWSISMTIVGINDNLYMDFKKYKQLIDIYNDMQEGFENGKTPTA